MQDIGPLESVARLAADRLVECYHRSQRPDWPWFESRMTYANAVLPHALFDAAERWPDEAFLDVAESSFAFLDLVTTTDDVFWPIGNRDWYSHGEEKSLYDQQPVEASTMAAAALAGLRTARRRQVSDCVSASIQAGFSAKTAWSNRWPMLRTAPASTACSQAGVNRNQGAESTLAYLWTELHKVSAQPTTFDPSRIVIASE